ncbi:cytochrome B [Arcticibacter tournemirensis]|uniref:Cytochrome B n=1 Tax=Arcticibacter tournemirensis TaxID=699437 RepID=A0A4Q0M4W5_9SPHI|nr:cytochrome B [Arcticibacter tournemirensis]RXF68020.1 cytochrome B [Arcticibacter tournemirensis]
MYEILFQAHSGLRFVVFFALVIAVVLAFAGWLGNRPYTKGNKSLNLITLISTHLQVVLGLVLYFYSPFVQFGGATMKDSTLRYWTVEHVAMMLIAAVLITVGNAKSKRALNAIAKHRSVAIYFGLALLIIVVAIIQGGRPLLGISH